MTTASPETYSSNRFQFAPGVHGGDAVIVIDREMNVVLEQARPPISRGLSNACVLKGRLTPELEVVVREAAAKWIVGGSTLENPIVPISGARVVRMIPMQGLAGPLLALTVESRREDQVLVQALERFALTQRELQVLRYILDGAQAGEIADELHIAENTVQVYFKRLLAKTRSRNRASMVATVLNWTVGRKRSLR